MPLVNAFIHIKFAKFPVLPGEEQELYNEGTYGKALAQYLESRLKERSYDVPFIGCEDWGWWVAVRDPKHLLHDVQVLAVLDLVALVLLGVVVDLQDAAAREGQPESAVGPALRLRDHV